MAGTHFLEECEIIEVSGILGFEQRIEYDIDKGYSNTETYYFFFDLENNFYLYKFTTGQFHEASCKKVIYLFIFYISISHNIFIFQVVLKEDNKNSF